MRSLNLYNTIDRTDLQILGLLVQNSSNKHISSVLKNPISTIQRRARNLIEKEVIVYII
jgi:predicted transcriptional regulator